MKIAYFNANLRQGQDGVTRCVYKMIEGALERDHEAIAITSTLPEETPPIPMYRVPSVVLPLQKNYRIALPGYASFSQINATILNPSSGTSIALTIEPMISTL